MNSFLFGVPKPWPMWSQFYQGLSLTMFGCKEKKDPLEYPQKTRAGLTPVCVVMMRIESPGKTKSGAAIGSRVTENGPLSDTCTQDGARALWHVDIQKDLLFGIAPSMWWCFFCVYPLCLLVSGGEILPQGESSVAQISSWHAKHRHKLRSASRLTALGVGSFPSPMSCGW